MFRYSFHYKDRNKITLSHYILTDNELTNAEQEQLRHMLSNFPHHVDPDWHEKFLRLNCNLYNEDLQKIAANAFDGHGNTVLAVACARGKPIEAVQKLINMGANLDTIAGEKLALHWAISNDLSSGNQTSIEAAKVVQCLLDNGAKTNIKCYQNMTPLIYARMRGYQAAGNLIANHIQDKQCYYRGATFGLFKQNFPKNICTYISNSIIQDPVNMAVNKDVYQAAKDEMELGALSINSRKFWS